MTTPTHNRFPPLVDGLGTSWPHRLLTLALLLLLVAPLSYKLFFSDFTTSENFQKNRADIYAIYLEAMHVADGTNPYSRIHAGDMRNNDKYPTYFPAGYYYFAALHHIGLDSWEAQFGAWRVAYLLFYLALGATIFAYVRLRGGYWLAWAAVVLVLYSRWGLYVTSLTQTDPPTIVLMLIALHMLARRQLFWACLLLGLSLAIKHFGVFVAPLFVVAAGFYGVGQKPAWGKAIWACLLIVLLPVLLSFPFLVDDFSGLFKSILFSATRDGSATVKSIDVIARLDGLPARLPMVAVLVLCYVAAIRRRVPEAAGALLVMSVFLGFNSVYFVQYKLWVVALIPCAIAEAVTVANHRSPGADGEAVAASDAGSDIKTDGKPEPEPA